MSVTIDGDAGISKIAPGLATTGPIFKATRAGGFNGSGTKVIVSDELFDSDNCYDPAIGRFTPTKAGYYLVTLAAGGNKNSSDTGWFFLKLYKNGVDTNSILGSNTFYPIGNGGYFSCNGSTFIYMNGTTDYIEMYYISSGTFATIDQALFEACLVRSA